MAEAQSSHPLRFPSGTTVKISVFPLVLCPYLAESLFPSLQATLALALGSCRTLGQSGKVLCLSFFICEMGTIMGATCEDKELKYIKRSEQ